MFLCKYTSRGVGALLYFNNSHFLRLGNGRNISMTSGRYGKHTRSSPAKRKDKRRLFTDSEHRSSHADIIIQHTFNEDNAETGLFLINKVFVLKTVIVLCRLVTIWKWMKFLCLRFMAALRGPSHFTLLPHFWRHPNLGGQKHHCAD